MFTEELELTDELGRPGTALVDRATAWQGRIVVLGAGGKMGGGIASMARRALDAAGRGDTQVVAVSRWSDPAARAGLDDIGVRTLEADLSDPSAVEGLPDAERVVFLVGAKFGTSGRPTEAWMTNTVLPAYVARRYARSSITALSTGNVYPLVAPVTGGAREIDPVGPVGEYAVTSRGREQVFSHGSILHGTPVSIVRLNYACEPRYGVLVDLARKILAGDPVDVSIGAVNVVWQRYASDVILQSLDFAATPPFVLNLAGPETASVRSLAESLGRRLGREPVFTGVEEPTSLLSDAQRCHELFGYPDRSLGQLVDMVAGWVQRGGTVWEKPTKFERRDGAF